MKSRGSAKSETSFTFSGSQQTNRESSASERSETTEGAVRIEGIEDHKTGRKKNVSRDTTNVRVGHNITDFIKSVGMSKSTFYNFIKSMDEMMEAGINLLELEEKVAKLEEEINRRSNVVSEIREANGSE